MELDNVRTGSCLGSPTSVTVVGLNLNGIKDSGSDDWQASSIITARNSELVLFSFRQTASINALDPCENMALELMNQMNQRGAEISHETER